MNARILVWLFVAAATAGRVVPLAMGGVTPDNAYFLLCGERPAPGYFDGPAGTAMMVRAVAAAGGEWWNFLGPLWAALASLAVWRLGRRLAGNGRAAGWAVVVLNTLPAFNTEALRAGPVMPALALSLAGAALAWEAWRVQKGGVGRWAAASLAFLGAGLFSPLALAPAAGLAVWVVARHRGKASAAAALALVGASLAGLAPWVWWLASVDWVPLGGWTLRGLSAFDPAAMGAGLVGAVADLSPAGALLLVVALVSCLRNPDAREGRIFAAWAGGAGCAVVAFWIFRGWDCGAAALFPAAFLLAPFLDRLTRPWLWAGLAAAVGGWYSLPVWKEAAGPRPEREAARALRELMESTAPSLPGGLFFIAGDARTAAALDHWLRGVVSAPEGHPRVYTPESQAPVSQFDFWPSYSYFRGSDEPPDELFTEQMGVNPFHGRSALYVGRESSDELPQAVRGAFSEVRTVREVGEGTRRLYIHLCLDYQSLPL